MIVVRIASEAIDPAQLQAAMARDPGSGHFCLGGKISV